MYSGFLSNTRTGSFLVIMEKNVRAYYNGITVQPCEFSRAYAGESLLSYAYALENSYGALPQRDEAQRNRADG